MSRFGNIDDLIEFDVDGSRNGRPLDLGDGRVLSVRRAGGHNRAFAAVYARVHAEYEDRMAADDPGDAFEAKLECERVIAARGLVAGWKGFTGPGGEAIECTEDAVLELFDLAPEVYDRVWEVARDAEEFRLAADTKSDT